MLGLGAPADPPGAPAAGTLFIVGGSERLDKHLRLLNIYARLVDSVPGRRSLVIVTTATGHPELLGGEYERIFRGIGWPRPDLLRPDLATREQANDPAIAALIQDAAGIYMTGGDQTALVETFAGTRAGTAMHAAYRAGAAIGGTSAGATAIGDPMIARGGGTGELRRGMIALHPGLGFTEGEVVIDTHFGQRGRFPRLVAAIAERPAALGMGLDENTAVLVRQGHHAEVLGSGVVYLMHSPHEHEASIAAGGAISIAPLTLHILHEGQCYDLETRRIEP